MSLRARVLIGLAVVALVMAGVTALVTRTVYHQLLQQVDDDLIANPQTSPSQIGSESAGSASNREPGSDDDHSHDEATDGGTGQGNSERHRDRELERTSPYFEAIVRSGGEVEVLFAPNLGDDDDEDGPDLASLDSSHFDRRQVLTVAAVDNDHSYRVAIQPVGHDAALIRALPLDNIEESLRRMIAMQVAGMAAVLAVLGAVAWWVIHLGIRPVKEMSRAAARIANGDLSVRVPATGPERAESTELATALNTMMGTIETAMARQADSEARLRRFVADASHELKTPVTTIRGYAELYRHGGLSDGPALDDAMTRTEAEATRMGRLVEDMLTLAKLDEERPLESATVDLCQLVGSVVDDARLIDPDHPVTLTTPGDPVLVTGDPDRLRQVVANLVTNVAVHTPAETAYSVLVETSGDDAHLVVTDEGPGMEPEVAARVTERFYRADASRSRASGGSGLGLAIVASIVEAHGGTIEVTSSPGQGTRVAVTVALALSVDQER